MPQIVHVLMLSLCAKPEWTPLAIPPFTKLASTPPVLVAHVSTFQKRLYKTSCFPKRESSWCGGPHTLRAQ